MRTEELLGHMAVRSCMGIARTARAAVARFWPEVRAAEELLHELQVLGVFIAAAQQLLVDVDVRLLPFALGSGLAPHFCCVFLLFAGGLARSHLR